MVYSWKNRSQLFTKCNGTSFDYKNDLAPRSIKGKKVVYVNPVPMGCAQWESYRMDVRRRLAMGKDVDRLVGTTQNFLIIPPFLFIIGFS
jgi:hypothetical protein